MKKGCIIVLVIMGVLFAGVVIAGLAGLRMAETHWGWRLAPEISHEEFATTETRIRLVLKPELLAPYLIDFVPDDAVDMPADRFELKEVLHHIIPREVALLARSDIIARRIRLTLFINEKRGGPLVATLVNEANPFAQAPQVEWTSNGLELHQRGALVAEGYIPIPGEVESELLQIWPSRAQEASATIEGNNQLELVIDNHNGDILALTGAIVAATGNDWNTLRQEDMADMAINIMESIHVARLAANMIDGDTAAIDLEIAADQESGPTLHFLLTGLAEPQLKELLQEDFNMMLTGNLHWDEQRSAIIGAYTLTGMDAFLTEQLAD